jgi:cellulose synthase/poly-beta-1,6-N-acetylglucosamine synthase-like glycosyltransferase
VTYRANKNLLDGYKEAITGIMMVEMDVAYRIFSTYNINPIVTGPGVLIPNEVLIENDGWPFLTISEDMELTAYLTSHKHKIYYQHNAIFYDEQPSDYKTIFRQRLRWQKGHFQVFLKYFGKLFLSIFSKNFFSSLILFIGILPFGLITILTTLGFGSYAIYLSIVNNNWIYFFWFTIFPMLIMIVGQWLIAILTLIVEHKRIHLPLHKKILYILVQPINGFIVTIVDCLQLFVNVEWKPIKHHKIRKEEINNYD